MPAHRDWPTPCPVCRGAFCLPEPSERPGPPSRELEATPTPHARREFVILLILVACGLFLVPLLIWVVGQGMLGVYANGGPLALLKDFFAGLKSGSALYWAVVFGPYVLVMLLRALWHLISRADGATD